MPTLNELLDAAPDAFDSESPTTEASQPKNRIASGKSLDQLLDEAPDAFHVQAVPETKQRGVIGEAVHSAVEPVKSLIKAPSLLTMNDDEWYQWLKEEHAKEIATEPAEGFTGGAARLLGGVAGGVGEFIASEAAGGAVGGPVGMVAGPALAFGASGSVESARAAGIRAIEQGFPKEQVVKISRSLAGVGAGIGAVTAVALPGTVSKAVEEAAAQKFVSGYVPRLVGRGFEEAQAKSVARSLAPLTEAALERSEQSAVKRVAKTAGVGAIVGGGGQAIENVAQKSEGLDVSPTEGVFMQAAVMGILPVLTHAKDLYRQARLAKDPKIAETIQKSADEVAKQELAKVDTTKSAETPEKQAVVDAVKAWNEVNAKKAAEATPAAASEAPTLEQNVIDNAESHEKHRKALEGAVEKARADNDPPEQIERLQSLLDQWNAAKPNSEFVKAAKDIVAKTKPTETPPATPGEVVAKAVEEKPLTPPPEEPPAPAAETVYQPSPQPPATPTELSPEDLAATSTELGEMTGEEAGSATSTTAGEATTATPAEPATKTETVKPKEENASKVSPSTEVHGDVPRKPVEGERQVPVEDSGAGVHEKTETPVSEASTKQDVKLGQWPENEWSYQHLKSLSMIERANRARYLGLRDKEGLVEVSPKKIADRAKQRLDEIKATPKPVAISESQTLTPAIVTEAGQTLTGANHAAIRSDAAKQGTDAITGSKEGFVNDKGEFVSRSEGAKWFEQKTGKKPATAGELHSEDLRDAGLLEHLPKESKETPPLAPEAKTESTQAAARKTEERLTDLADWVKDNYPGGIKVTSKSDYRGLADRKKGVARNLIFLDKGTPADIVMQHAELEGIVKHGSEDSFLNAVLDAAEGRKGARSSKASLESNLDREADKAQRFGEVALQNKRRSPADAKAAKPVGVDSLSVGDKFALKGEVFTVKNVDAEGTVTVEGGNSGKQIMQDGEPFYPDNGKVISAIKGATTFGEPEAKKPSGELFPTEETPFNLAGEKVEMVAPKTETTGYGSETLAQDELFGIQKVVESKDPTKSADAAEKLYGGPRQAIEKIENQLRVVDSDVQTRKAFVKEQRGRLKEVIALLRQRTLNAVPTGEGHTIEGARAEAEKAFGTLSDRVSFVHEPDNPSAAYTDRNKIVVNVAKVAPGTVEKVLLEEGLHGVWNELSVQDAWKQFRNGVTEYEIAAERAKRKGLDTSRETLKEEAAISKLLNKPDAPMAKKVWDAVIAALDKLFGVKVGDNREELLNAARSFLQGESISPESSKMMEHPSVPISFIDKSQAHLDPSIVDRYRAAIRNGEPLEPIRAVIDQRTGRFSVTDGHHRLEAAKQEGLSHIPLVENVIPHELRYENREGFTVLGRGGYDSDLQRREGTQLGYSPGPSGEEKIQERPYSMAARPVRELQPSGERPYTIDKFPNPEAYGRWVIGGRRILSTGRPVYDQLEKRYSAPTTGKAPIEQYADALKGIKGEKRSLREQFGEAFDVGSRLSKAKDAFGKGLDGLKATGDFLIERFKGIERVDDLLRAKGLLSQALETRGNQVYQWVRAAKKAVPQGRYQAAIRKWVDAGGDIGKLKEGARETKPQFRRAYEDAQNLSSENLKIAQETRKYHEARLQEAIDAGVLEDGVTDYIHRMYERRPDLGKKLAAFFQSGILKTNPALTKERVFTMDWQAEKEGFVPNQSFIDAVAEYESSLSRAIAARQFVARSNELMAPDGRPVVDIKGMGIPITDEEGKRSGTLIKPQFNPKKANVQGTPNYRADYVNREYSALSKWKWVSSDAGGKPIFVQGDVAIHPKYVQRFDALLEPSRVRYGKYGHIMRPALAVSSAFKQTMLDLSGFHQVQIAVHAAEHKVMPWNIAQDIDFQHPDTQLLLRSGMTIGGEYHYAKEGLIGNSLIRQVPILGPLAESYHEWLFRDFIPRVKYTMARKALERNRERYAGKMSEEQIGLKTATQANDAFGGQNMIMLERSKTAQDMARLIMLAPDFLESRAKFAASALTLGGKRFGNEQRTALLLGALTMYTAARVINQLDEGHPHFEPENMFSWVHNGQAYSLRTVQGDILHLLEKPLNFWMHRLNPVFGRTLLEVATQRDEFGRKRSIPEIAWDSVSSIVPISLRTSRERSILESLYNAFGITDRRWQDTDDAFKLARKWKDEHGIGERGEFIYDPDKDPLRGLKVRLSRNDDAGAANEIKKLLESKTYTMEKLDQYFRHYRDMSFTGSKTNDKKWQAELTDDQKKTVDAAKDHKVSIAKLYQKARGQYNQALANPP